MRNLNDTLNRLTALRGKVARDLTGSADIDRLSGLPLAGCNPGALRGRFYVPQSLRPSAALVVVLHGCTQDAASYDHGSGWSRLADEQGFALLYPEQRRGNNANLCFNWFNQGDTRRDSGEAMSIRQMIMTMIAQHAIDPARVFVTGLSAGGAMTSVMLATYPEVFAAGAIVAGLPYGTAASIPEAFDRMRAHGGPPATALGRLVTDASPHRGPWPRISVWHGDSDATVSRANSALIVEQWRAIHDVAGEPTAVEHVDGHMRNVWRDAHGRDVIEEYRIAGLGHGLPLNTSGVDACGASGPYMLEAGIPSTRRIASFWGLVAGQVEGRLKPARSPTLELVAPATHRDAQSRFRGSSGSVERIIDDALRAAGLMR